MQIATVVGARPEFIQASPLLRAIERYNREKLRRGIRHFLIHTGQHYDYQMSKVFFDELKLKKPDHHLGVGSGTPGYQTAEIIKRLETVLLQIRPDLVIVFGDTNSTVAGALAAIKLHIKVVHIEAGVRSYNRYMPEEINRLLTDQIADIHFCPSKSAVDNLAKEGIKEGVYFVGDIMYDAILHNIKNLKKSKIIEILGLRRKKYAIATVHRAENTDIPERLVSIFRTLNEISARYIPIIVPTHPRTYKKLKEIKLKLNNLRFIEPVSYLDMINLQKNAKLIFTDSGGMQKEAFYLKVPCITLRTETEWVETVDLGWNRLAGWKAKDIENAFQNVDYKKNHPHPHVYGNGRTAAKILSYLLDNNIKPCGSQNFPSH